jgi:hypothetical protein
MPQHGQTRKRGQWCKAVLIASLVRLFDTSARNFERFVIPSQSDRIFLLS